MTVESLVVCGLDLSLTSTGICIFPKGENGDFINFNIAVKSRGAERLGDISNGILDCISVGTIDFLALEGYSYGSKYGKHFEIGELGGVVKLDLHRLGIVPVIVPPTSLKKFICESGAAKKELMREWVYRRYGVGSDILKSSDEVDAFALCKMGYSWLRHRNGISKGLTKKQIEALEKI